MHSCVYETKVSAHCKYRILIIAQANLSKWSRVATLSLLFVLSQLSQCGHVPTFRWRDLSPPPPPYNSRSHISLFFLLLCPFLSLPAVRDNYFQTSGPLGEAVLSKAAFIKNSCSCVDVFALQCREWERDGKSDKKGTQKVRRNNSNTTRAGILLCPGWQMQTKTTAPTIKFHKRRNVVNQP